MFLEKTLSRVQADSVVDGLPNYVLLESEGVAVAVARYEAPMSGDVVYCAKTTGAAGSYG
jgi:hypothetical protein